MKHNQLKSGVILSYLNLGISILIPLFYTPVMLRMLGQNEYGLYSLSQSAVAYLSLLSFGFGSTIVRYIAKFRAEKQKTQEERVYGFFILLYSLLAVIVLIVGFYISYNVEPIFNKGLESEELEKMKILVKIMTFNSALSFPISVFSSMITAYERYIVRKLVDMFATVAAPIANLIALYFGYASVGMAIASTVIQFMILPISIWYCTFSLKLYPKFGFLPKKLIKEMLNFSLFIFIGSIVDMLFWATDKVLLGMLANSVAVAIYNVGGTFNTIVMSLSSSVSGVLMPRLTGMFVKNVSSKELTELFIKLGRIQFLMIGLVVSGFFNFGRSFISLWAGSNYLDAYWVAIMTMFPLCIPLIQSIGHSILVAQNKHAFRSVVYLIIAIINVISTYFLIPKFGVIGAALCSCIAYLLGQGLVMNLYYYKVIGIDIPLFWRNILNMFKIPLIMMLLTCILNYFVDITSWVTFFFAVSIYTVIYCLLMFKYIMNDYEKSLLLTPIRALLGIIK